MVLHFMRLLDVCKYNFSINYLQMLLRKKLKCAKRAKISYLIIHVETENRNKNKNIFVEKLLNTLSLGQLLFARKVDVYAMQFSLVNLALCRI